VTGRSWIVSTDGGYSPLWTRNGNRIIYLSSVELMQGLDVGTEPEFRAGDSSKAFTTELDRHGRTYDVTPDGSRLLIGIAARTTRRSKPVSASPRCSTGSPWKQG
jgi:hypothetical protein